MPLLQRLRRRLGRFGSASTAAPPFETTSLLMAEADKPALPKPAELTGSSRAWLAKLPPRARPLELGRRHPRIVNQLALCWSDHELTERVLASLIVDQRGGRQGFAAEVLAELMTLREFHADRALPGGSPEALWADSTLATVDR